jgi:hypothetical protein
MIECAMPPQGNLFSIQSIQGHVPYVQMTTLSWFWVPVIAHALRIQGYPQLPSDQHLQMQGALFALSEIVTIVSMLLQNMQFVMQGNEVVGQGPQFYVSADAQNRLMYILLSPQIVGVHNNNVMVQVVNWFDCLWAAEATRLSVMTPQRTRLAIAAAIRSHWMRAADGSVVFIQTNGMQVHVWI